MRRSLSVVALASLALALSAPSRAADADDLYLEVLGGARFSGEVTPQGGFAFGYCPFNDLGIGFAFDQAGADTLHLSVEARWMIEPLEVHASVGFYRYADPTGANIDTHPLLTVGGSYLMALTPSMAGLLDVKYQAVVAGKGSIFAGVGGRVVF